MESPRPTSSSRRSARRAASSEVEELRARLAEAQQRAEVAESALPELLALGRKTADALVEDAQRRSEAMIEDARLRAIAELDDQRREVRREAKELEALRLAVAAEAMGLEQIRSELQHRVSVSAAELARIAGHPGLLGGAPLRLPEGGLPELEAVGREDSGVVANPSPQFAAAWTGEEGDDDAFERFLQGDEYGDPSRDWILGGSEESTA